MNSLLAGLFLELGLSVHAQVPSDAGRWDIQNTVNPYGDITIGWEKEFSPTLSGRVYGRHGSAVRVYDYGTDSVGASLIWRPFK